MQNVLSLILVLTFSIPALAEKSLKEYWAATRISFNEVYRLLDDSRCYGNGADAFRACASAIRGIGLAAEKNLELLPTSLLNEFEVSEVVRQAGDLSLVILAEQEVKKDADLRQMYERDEARRLHVKQRMERVYESQKPADRINFVELAKFVHEKYLKSLDVDSFATGLALNANLEVLDGHGLYFPTAYKKEVLMRADKNIVGIGALLSDMNGHIVILKPVAGGAAIEAGMRSNDEIVSVDGKSIAGVPMSELISNRIRGEEGKPVTIGIRRNGQELSFTMVRRNVNILNVDSEVVNHSNTKIGVITLRSFMDRGACLKVKDAIASLEAQQVKGLVLDLRTNQGGELGVAQCMAGMFLGAGKTIVKVKGIGGFDSYTMGWSSPALTGLPLVVLVDANSASASELVAGALQDNARAWIVGERTFGKGSVQTIVNVNNDISGVYSPFVLNDLNVSAGVLDVKFTTALFYQPTGRTNQLVGIIPDFTVPTKPNASEKERFVLRERERVPNALKGDGLVQWVQPRGTEISSIQSCIDSSGNAKKSYDAAVAAIHALDYQLAYAEDILRCSQSVGLTTAVGQ